ncbi:hypothetical protein PCE1_002224 [Barthelona sp. PCE]
MEQSWSAHCPVSIKTFDSVPETVAPSVFPTYLTDKMDLHMSIEVAPMKDHWRVEVTHRNRFDLYFYRNIDATIFENDIRKPNGLQRDYSGFLDVLKNYLQLVVNDNERFKILLLCDKAIVHEPTVVKFLLLENDGFSITCKFSFDLLQSNYKEHFSYHLQLLEAYDSLTDKQRRIISNNEQTIKSMSDELSEFNVRYSEQDTINTKSMKDFEAVCTKKLNEQFEALDAVVSQKQDLERQVDQLKGELSEFIRRNSVFAKEKKDLLVKVDDCNRLNEEEKTKNKGLRDRITELENVVTQSKKEYDGIFLDKTTLEAQLNEKKLIIGELQFQREHSETHANDLKVSLRSREDSEISLRQQIEKLTQQLAEVQSEAKQMKSTTRKLQRKEKAMDEALRLKRSVQEKQEAIINQLKAECGALGTTNEELRVVIEGQEAASLQKDMKLSEKDALLEHYAERINIITKDQISATPQRGLPNPSPPSPSNAFTMTGGIDLPSLSMYEASVKGEKPSLSYF